MLKKMKVVCVVVVVYSLISCNGGKMDVRNNSLASVKDVSGEAWHQLSEKKIFFGHQSVGFNIIDGILDVMKNNPSIKLNIAETDNSEAFVSPVLAHSRLGKNVDPSSKCASFRDLLLQGVGNKVDIAFFKFCYVDFLRGTDPEKVFMEYKTVLSLLKQKFPQTKFVHVTVPLTAPESGLKSWVKSLLGKRVAEYEENSLRHQYNQKLIKEYQGREPIFDLAKIESTYPDGTRASFEQNGLKGYFLIPQYTDDGGHLNQKGREVVAEQLLILLAKIANGSTN
jgi:hypothetical protein